MTDDERALLRAIAANPDDDTVRLALADHLEELGGEVNVARAEFIRAQVRRQRRDVGDREAADLRARESDLLAEYAAEWAADLPDGFEAATGFRRGFLYRAKATASAVLAAADDARTEVLDILHLTVDVTPTKLADVFRCPAVARLTDLVLVATSPLAQAGGKALAGGVFPRLDRLSLAGCGLGDGGVSALAAATGFPRLRVLDLSNNKLTDKGGKALLDSPLARNLRWLDLGGNAVNTGSLGAGFPGVLVGVSGA